MGVQGLWELLSPVGQRVPNSHVRHKRIAVDASIWLTQFVRAMRESEGAMLPNAHLIGIFRRCCKLLFLAVKPVLVFDGATPALKRHTRNLRRAQRDRDVVKLRKLAERLLLNQMRSAAVNAVVGASRNRRSLTGRISKRRRIGSLSPPKADEFGGKPPSATPGYKSALDDDVLPCPNDNSDFEKPSPPSIPKPKAKSLSPGPGYESDLDLLLQDETEMTRKAGKKKRKSLSHGPGYDPELDIIPQDEQKLARQAARDDIIEEPEPKINVVLPEDLNEIDDDALANLPPTVQAEVFRQIRQRQRAQHRDQVMSRQNDPEEFSKAQIVGFMKNTTLNRRIKSIRKAINSKSGANQRIASDSKRMYLLEENDDDDEDDLGMESSEGELENVHVRDVSPEHQQLDLLTRIRIQRERRKAPNADQGLVSANVAENDARKDFGLGWASKVLQTGGNHKLGATLEDDAIDCDASSGEDRPILEVQNSIAQQQSKHEEKRKIDSDSDDDMEWEDGATVPALPSTDTNIAGASHGEQGRATDKDRCGTNIMLKEIEEVDDVQTTKIREEKAALGDSDDNIIERKGGVLAKNNELGITESLVENEEDVALQKAIMLSMQRNSRLHRERQKAETSNDDITPRLVIRTPETSEEDEEQLVAHSAKEKRKESVTEEVEIQQAIMLSMRGRMSHTRNEQNADLSRDEITPRIVLPAPEKGKAYRNSNMQGRNENLNEFATDLRSTVNCQGSSVPLREQGAEEYSCGPGAVLDKDDGGLVSNTLPESIRKLDCLESAGNSNEESFKHISKNRTGDIFGQDGDASVFRSESADTNDNNKKGMSSGEHMQGIAVERVPTRRTDSLAVLPNDLNGEGQTKENATDEAVHDEIDQHAESIGKGAIADREEAVLHPAHTEIFEDDPALRATIEAWDQSRDHHLNEANIARAESILNADENENETGPHVSQVNAYDEAEVERIRNGLESERADLLQQQHKQRKVVESVTEEMIAETRDLLRLFGIPFIEAPMEAEAQCAFLDLKGLVDGVITEDSDAFLFGARTVYRRLFSEGKFAEAYSTSAIKSELGIDRKQLINLAYLLGSDYTPGVRGIGIVNSMEVLEAFPGENGLKELLEWTNTVTILDEQPDEETMQSTEQLAKRRQFCWKHRNIKRNWIFHQGFPNPQVAEAYWNPAVNTSDEPFTWKPVDFAALEQFCYKKFGWDSVHFNAAVGPLRHELQQRQTMGPEQRRIEQFFKPHRFAKIKSVRLQRAVRGIAGDSAEKLMAEPKDKPGNLNKNTAGLEETGEAESGFVGDEYDDVAIVTKDNLGRLSAKEMRKELHRLGLSTKGTEAELRSRLNSMLAGLGKRQSERQ